jgi:hypothetical protein
MLASVDGYSGAAAMNRIAPKRFVQVCWVGLATGALVGILIGIFQAQIESNSWLAPLVMVGLLPAGIVHLTLIWQMVERYRWWCLLIFVLLPWPIAFYLGALLMPVGFLALLTHRIYARAAETYVG